MSGPEFEQTDIIPALRADDDTAVDVFGPVAGARHRRPARSRVLPAAGVTAILAASAAAMYATYMLGGHTPTGPAPVPSVVSEAPAVAEPVSSSPVARPSRTQADRRRRRPTPTRSTHSPAPTSGAPSPSPARTPPSPAPRTHPTTVPPTSEQPDPPPSPEAPQSPTEIPEVESS